MRKHPVKAALCAMALAVAAVPALACTSMIIGPKASKTGRPMLWKNRDTGTVENFVERIAAKDGDLGYAALFNAGDSLLREAWMGVNEAGFGIMNTASYNLAPDTAHIKDREGEVMSAALKKCRTVRDFAALLDTLPKPMGVQANFGVIDAEGNGAYFETDDYTYKIYSLKDSENDVLVRTNFSYSGNETDGMGYIRYDNARHILADKIKNGGFVPEDFTERASRSFYHSLLGRDIEADTTFHYFIDQDFIPRRSTSASVVIEGVCPSDNPSLAVMWTLMGYPPCGHVEASWADYVPVVLRPTRPGFKSEASDKAMESKRKAFPITRGSGSHYLDMDYIRAEQQRQRELSADGYSRGRRGEAKRAMLLKGKRAVKRGK